MRWEYKTENFSFSQPPHPTELERLNELGQEGWELMFVRKAGDYYFKRPIYEATPLEDFPTCGTCMALP